MPVYYDFEGALVATTGLHVGSGYGDFTTDARFVRSGGQLYIPGSSLKGALRSALERLIAGLPSPDGSGQLLRTCLLDASSGWGDPTCPTVNPTWQEAFTRARAGDLSEAEIAKWLYGAGDVPATLCDTCQLFGSPYCASKVYIHDLPLIPATDEATGAQTGESTEVRHGVGIDRDTGTARPQIKFDFEVVPAETAFCFSLRAEDLTPPQVGLLCIGLREMEQGHVPIGGKVSRGLGICRLTLETVRVRDLTTRQQWLAALLGSSAEEPEPATGRGAVYRGAAIQEYCDGAIRSLLNDEVSP